MWKSTSSLWTQKGPEKRPYLLEWRASRGFIIFVVVFAVFTDTLLYGLIVPVTPTALHEKAGLAVGEEQKWTSILLGLYSGALLALSPPAGYLADRIESRRWPLILGLVALGAATALLCIGTHIALWIVGRLFQGASAAVVWTVGCALLVDTVEKDALGQALGFIGMGMTLGAMGGPLLAGVIYEHSGYYSVYALAFALVALDIVLRIVMIERNDAVKWLAPERCDTPEPKEGSIQGSEGSSPSRQDEPIRGETGDGEKNSNPNNLAERRRSSSSREPAPAPETTSTLRTRPDPPDEAPKKRKQKKNPSALYTLLASDRFLITIWAYFILATILTSFDSVLPLFVAETFTWKQSAQGLIFVPLTIPHLLDPVFGYINDRYGEARRYIASAAFFAAVPALVLLRLVTENTTQHKLLLCALLSVVGLCLASMLSPLLAEASYVVQEKEAETPDIFGKGGAMALAYGVLNSAFAAGGIAGPFLAGFIREDAGWGTMAWALALVMGVSGVPVLLFLGGFIFKRRERRSVSEGSPG